MMKAEFRVLQLIISHVTGDRISMALLHWSGGMLRVASSLERLAVCDPDQRDVAKASIKSLVRRANKLARELSSTPQLDTGLQQLFPVREGLGGALYWTPVTTVETTNPLAHFEELQRTLYLDRARLSHKRRFGSKALRRQLVVVGNGLRVDAPDHVRVDETVKFKKAYRSPLSWKNGIWHHALPFSLDGLEPDEIDREVERMVGLAELALPKSDVPVVVAVMPVDAQDRRRVRREAQLVSEALASRNCEVLETKLKGKDIQLDSLIARIESDVASDHR